MSSTSLYETDLYAWTEEQARRLREHNTELDWDNLAEEIESLGRSDRRELKSRLEIILVHLLKWRYQMEHRSRGWRGSIREQQKRVRLVLKDSPSLHRELTPKLLQEIYANARCTALEETGVYHMPELNPFSLEEVLDGELEL